MFNGLYKCTFQFQFQFPSRDVGVEGKVATNRLQMSQYSVIIILLRLLCLHCATSECPRSISLHVVLVVIDRSASACLVMDCAVFCRRVQTAAHKLPLADCIHYWLISLHSSDFFISSVIFPSRCPDSRPRLRSVRPIFDGGVSCVTA